MQTYHLSHFLRRQTNLDIEKLELSVFFEDLGGLQDGVWLAGGAVRRTLAKVKLDSDFDLFFRDENLFKNTIQKITERFKILKKTERENNIEILVEREGRKYTIQLIKFSYYANVGALLDSFDFTICQFALDKDGNLTCGDYSLWDLARKRLAVHKIALPVSSMRRLIKYTQQGFYACSGCIADVMNAAVENPTALDQFISID